MAGGRVGEVSGGRHIAKSARQYQGRVKWLGRTWNSSANNPGSGPARLPPKTSLGLGQWIYWGLNGGLLVFFLGLVADSSPLIRVGTPILGTALLTAIIVHLAGLGAATSTTEEALITDIESRFGES